LPARDIGLDAVADDDAVRGRHAESREGDLEDDRRRLADDHLHRRAVTASTAAVMPAHVRDLAALDGTGTVGVGGDEARALPHRLQARC